MSVVRLANVAASAPSRQVRAARPGDHTPPGSAAHGTGVPLAATGDQTLEVTAPFPITLNPAELAEI